MPPHILPHGALAQRIDIVIVRAIGEPRPSNPQYTAGRSASPGNARETTYASVGWRFPLDGFTRNAHREALTRYHAESPSAWLHLA
jgi:hypothetical protein